MKKLSKLEPDLQAEMNHEHADNHWFPEPVS